MGTERSKWLDGARVEAYGLAELSKTFLRFGAVGLFVTGFNFVVFFALAHFGADYVVAAIGGWFPSTVIGFYLNRRRTFMAKGGVQLNEFLGYGAACVLQLAASLVMFAVLVDGFSISLFAAALCNLFILPLLNFLALRFFVFPEARRE